ncbi:MAG: hypothetical protein KME21_17490 [Desmonostoc vinosum HA7617-LM4]|nr:hypothetical protein [Desmonostoc vinosum HA7617-LM4]
MGNWELGMLASVGFSHSIQKSLFFRSEIFLPIPASPRPPIPPSPRRSNPLLLV